MFPLPDRTPEQAQLAAAYLASDDPLEQSGFSGGRLRWERLRRPVADAVTGSGSILDVGCANGALLEDLVAWCRERDVDLDPWGLDISTDLVELARRRCPGRADRFFVGNADTWSPPRRWDVVRIELVYVVPAARTAFVRRLLAQFLAPGGVLLVCRYRDPRKETARPLDVELRAELTGLGFRPRTVLTGMDVDGRIGTAVAVLEHSEARSPFRDRASVL